VPVPVHRTVTLKKKTGFFVGKTRGKKKINAGMGGGVAIKKHQEERGPYHNKEAVRVLGQRKYKVKPVIEFIGMPLIPPKTQAIKHRQNQRRETV